MDELLRDFHIETNESLDVVGVELVRFEQEPNNARTLEHIFRLVHTIKGTCGFLDLPRLKNLAHAAESLIGKFRNGMPVTVDSVSVVLRAIDRVKQLIDSIEKLEREPDGNDDDIIRELGLIAGQGGPSASHRSPPAAADGADRAEAPDAAGELGSSAQNVASQTVRVGVETLDHLMVMVSELLLTQNQLLDIARRSGDTQFKLPLQRLSTVTSELQDGIMRTRMQPIGNAWQKLPRIVRDLMVELGKEIELELHGADTALDRQVMEIIRDPLTDMVRNSADHGLESTAERIAAGKPEKGTIRLSAYHQGSHVVVSIADDGRGLNTARIKEKAIAAGLATPDELERMSEQAIHKFIFKPGFSTAANVTSVSGRGVGMDVVRNNIDQIGGSITVHSAQGQGTNVTIKIPLTLAIISVLIVEAGGERFAIPQPAVVEIVRVHGKSNHRIERIRDAAMLRLRNRLLPLVSLAGALKLKGNQLLPEKSFIVVIHAGGQSVGLVVDNVVHTEEVVVKPLARKLRGLGVFSGITIQGDGSVIMIIDPNGIPQANGQAVGSSHAAHAEADAAKGGTAETTLSLLVFRAGSQQPKAVPISLVTRLEKIDCRAIELSNGRHMVQYRGQLMPLVRASEDVKIKTDGAQPILVFSDGERSMGLVVDEIVDIVDDKLAIEVSGVQPGVLGSAVVRGRATEILDVGHFLPLAFEDWFRARKGVAVSQDRTLLLVDDSSFFRNMLTPMLEAAGYSVTAAASASDALAMLKSGRRFDMLLTDIEMPGMDGFALAEAVHQDSSLKSMPIVALSSYTTPDTIARGRSAGFDDHIAKFDRQNLLAVLKAKTSKIVKAA